MKTVNSGQFTVNSKHEYSKGARGWVILVLLALALIAVLAAPAQSATASTGTGVGIILGSPSGLSIKIPQGARSINLIIGYDLNGSAGGSGGPGCCDGSRVYVGGDYVWYNYGLIPVTKGRLPLYYGPGIYAAVSDPRSVVGIRFPVGLEYQFSGAPFDAFVELGPRINIVPDTRGDIFVGLGGRFFF